MRARAVCRLSRRCASAERSAAHGAGVIRADGLDVSLVGAAAMRGPSRFAIARNEDPGLALARRLAADGAPLLAAHDRAICSPGASLALATLQLVRDVVELSGEVLEGGRRSRAAPFRAMGIRVPILHR